jgi:cell division ATPase FtsA
VFKTASKEKVNTVIEEYAQIVYLQNIAITEVIKGAGITKQDLKYLIVGMDLYLRQGHFELKGIERALRAECIYNVRMSCVRLVSLGYVEQIKGRKYGSKVGRKYITTGKAEYLVKNYNKIIKRLLNEVNNR